MPLYEYGCKTCAHQFELLVRSTEVPACPSCHGTALERKLSVFAAHTGGAPARQASPGPGSPPRTPARWGGDPCGACGDPRGPGACSLN